MSLYDIDWVTESFIEELFNLKPRTVIFTSQFAGFIAWFTICVNRICLYHYLVIKNFLLLPVFGSFSIFSTRDTPSSSSSLFNFFSLSFFYFFSLSFFFNLSFSLSFFFSLNFFSLNFFLLSFVFSLNFFSLSFSLSFFNYFFFCFLFVNIFACELRNIIFSRFYSIFTSNYIISSIRFRNFNGGCVTLTTFSVLFSSCLRNCKFSIFTLYLIV